MKEISLKDVADGLDEMLDELMTGQARITAHLIAAAEAGGCSAEEIIAILDKVVEMTVLDELWITDEKGFAYLTNVRDEKGVLIPFCFVSDPEAQPQASAFYPLLSASTDADEVTTQAAQVREIDWEIYKYVGVSGIDRQRIVQVGNALAFEEQGLLANSYASPVMTAVLAAFGENDLLSLRYTSRIAEIRSVFDSIMSKQMIVQASLVDAFVTCSKEAGWSPETVNSHLQRIARSSKIEEIQVATLGGQVTQSSSMPYLGLRHADTRGPTEVHSKQVIVHPVRVDKAGRPAEKSVTICNPESARIVQVTALLDNNSLVSPHYEIP